MSGELKVNWKTVTWRELIAAIREQKAESSLAAPSDYAPDVDDMLPDQDRADELVTCWECNGDGIDPANGDTCWRCRGNGETRQP
jgi:hypothetical protein